MSHSFANNAAIQDFLIREKRLVLIPETPNALPVSDRAMAAARALNLDIAQLGFTLSGEVMKRVETLDEPTVKEFHETLVTALRAAVGANVRYRFSVVSRTTCRTTSSTSSSALWVTSPTGLASSARSTRCYRAVTT
jgi:hypothetical protein